MSYNLGPVRDDLEQDPPVVTKLGLPPTLATPPPQYGKREVDGSAPSQPHCKKENIEAEMFEFVRAMTNFCKVHSGASSSQFTMGNMLGNSEVSHHPRTINKFIHWLSELSLSLLESRYHEAIEQLLENKERQHAFLRMPTERRLKWLYHL